MHLRRTKNWKWIPHSFVPWLPLLPSAVLKVSGLIDGHWVCTFGTWRSCSSLGSGTETRLSTDGLKHYAELLARYVENLADRELQLLYAVQSVVTQRQHPKGQLKTAILSGPPSCQFVVVKTLFSYLNFVVAIDLQVSFKTYLRTCTTAMSSLRTVSSHGCRRTIRRSARVKLWLSSRSPPSSLGSKRPIRSLIKNWKRKDDDFLSFDRIGLTSNTTSGEPDLMLLTLFCFSFLSPSFCMNAWIIETSENASRAPRDGVCELCFCRVTRALRALLTWQHGVGRTKDSKEDEWMKKERNLDHFWKGKGKVERSFYFHTPHVFLFFWNRVTRGNFK